MFSGCPGAIQRVVEVKRRMLRLPIHALGEIAELRREPAGADELRAAFGPPPRRSARVAAADHVDVELGDDGIARNRRDDR